MKLKYQILAHAVPGEYTAMQLPGRPKRRDVEEKLNAYEFGHEGTSDLDGAELMFVFRRQHALSVWNAAMAVLMAGMVENSCYTYCEHWYGSGLVKR